MSEEENHASWHALNKQKSYRIHLELLSRLKYHTTLHKELGITETKVQETMTKLQTNYRNSCKTFTVCPTCDKALTGKKRKKTSSSFVTYDCSLCGAPSYIYIPSYITLQNRKIHHTETLAEARITLYKTHPELFI